MTNPLNVAPTPESTSDIHKVADTDSSVTAAHHTLGVQPNQASPGDHIHDGRTSKAINVNSRIIRGIDSRTVVDTPANMRTAAAGGMALLAPDFKNGATIGLPSAYYGVETIIPWSDDSGGGVHQRAVGSGGIDDVYTRYGTSAGGWGPWRKAGNGVKSIQRGLTVLNTGSTVTNVTIAAVDPAKCIIHLTHDAYDQVPSSGELSSLSVRGYLTSTTNLELALQRAPDGGSVSWQVVEYA